MTFSRTDRLMRGALVVIAVLFGVVTVFAGGRVLAGSDPGYVVFRPLVIYNTVMGIAYVAAGVLAWRTLAGGCKAAATILGLNLVVLGVVVYLNRTGSAVALDSVWAMILRTFVWLVIYTGLRWLRGCEVRRG